jgi:hypothetical protein
MPHHMIPVAVGEAERLHGRALGDAGGNVGQLPREVAGVDHEAAPSAHDDGACHLPDAAENNANVEIRHFLSPFSLSFLC